MSHPLRAAHKLLVILSLIVKRMLCNIVAKNKLQIILLEAIVVTHCPINFTNALYRKLAHVVK